MPKKSHKTARHGVKHSTETESLRLAIKDFSVYDYSRSSKDSPRNNLRTTSKLTRESRTLLDEQDWYEKDLSDFDDPYISDDETQNRSQPSSSSSSSSKQKQNSKQTLTTETIESGIDYPIDLWYLIAMYIPPEDIGKFSLICRSSNQVVNTIVFWMRLFRKHNHLEASKIGGILVYEHFSVIRTHVIKSLYRIYPPFQDRLNKNDIIQKDPHFLRLSRCVRIWYSKGASSTPRESYNYYFEFRFDHPQTTKSLQLQATSPILQNSNQYIIDKNACILHLICSNFVPIGPFMGMILSQITLNLSSDYRYYKLKMSFDSSRLCFQSAKKYNDSVVIIDPILCLKVYNWYNSPANFD